MLELYNDVTYLAIDHVRMTNTTLRETKHQTEGREYHTQGSRHQALGRDCYGTPDKQAAVTEI